MKNILISVRPEHVCKILNKEKILEIRKSIPKCELPCKVYIYCTKGKDLWMHNKETIILGDTNLTSYWLNGKVVAEFTLNKYDLLVDYGSGIKYVDKDLYYLDVDYLRTNSCLTDEQIYFYLGLKKDSGYYNDGYVWHIDNLIIYDKPKELSDFTKVLDCKYCIDYNRMDSGFICPDCINANRIKRPPQSWCYVE